MTSTIRLEIDGAVATITLNRPEQLHAIDPDMLQSLESYARQLDDDPSVRALIVTATGERAFSAGADVNAWSEMAPLDMWRRWVRDGHRTIDALAGLRQPTIAAINGMAFGGGLELALATDVRITSRVATFASPEVRIGTVPGWGGTRRLTYAVGASRAKQMIFSGTPIDAETALAWGLVNEVVDGSALLDRCMELAAAFAANSPVAVQLAKQVIDSGTATTPALEAIAGGFAAFSEDAQEGIAAFRQKRSPEFTGE